MDLLSAALDESGITGEDFDFDFSAPVSTQDSQYVQEPVQQVMQQTGPVAPSTMPVVMDGPDGSASEAVFSQALKQLAAQNSSVQTRHPNTGASSIPTPSVVMPPSPSVSLLQRTASSPAIVKLPPNTNQGSVVQLPQMLRQQPISVTQSIPGGTTGANTPARTKIITVKRVGPNGSVTQSASFAIDGKTAAGIGAQKIVLRSGSGTQSPALLRSGSGTPSPALLRSGSGVQSPALRTGSPVPAQIGSPAVRPVPAQIGSPAVRPVPAQIGSPAVGTLKLPANRLQSSTVAQLGHAPVVVSTNGNSAFENQYKQFTQSYSGNSGKVNMSVQQANTVSANAAVRTQPHVIHINRPITNPSTMVLARTVSQAPAVSARLINSQSTPLSPNIRVIHRPFQSSPGVNQVLRHSQSVPTELAAFTNGSTVSHHIVTSRQTNSPPVVQRLNSTGLTNGLMCNSSVVGGYTNGISSLVGSPALSSLSAMQKSVQNLPVPKPTNKDVLRMWSNEDVRLKSMTHNGMNQVHLGQQASMIEEEEEGEEVEGLGQAETYSEYMPSKLKLGNKHPDPVVETSSMSSIEIPDIYYKLSIPESTIDYGELSALQLESIVYASQRHNITLPCGERGGFLIGDGAGVGKGRTVAGIIFENYLLGRKRALWLSVSNDLRLDAERDLRDIGASKIDVHALNKFKYAKISSKVNGSVKKGVIFATYSSLIGESHSGGKYKTRFKQLIKWCGKQFDGVIVFDECHKAKNLCPTGSSKPTKTGQTVLELQKRLPKARVVYASATGASEPKNMAYMTRLGLWGQGTAFPEFNDFIQAVEKRGVGAMELVAMDMKLRGMYIARQLSFKGVSFKIEEIPIDKEFVRMYNEAVSVWTDARELFQEAAELVDAEHRMRKSMWGQFWSAHQRFFKYLCISAKVPHCVRLARDAIKAGKCVVIGLQSTGEARTLEQLEEMGGELNDFVSTAKGVLQTVVEKHFPAPDRRKFLDIFGLGNSSYNNEDSQSSFSSGMKRKKDQISSIPAKRQKGGDTDSSSDSEESEFDFGLSDTSDDNDNSDSDNDNFNPFGAGSDSDDDPWLKKKNTSKVKEKKKKEKKKKEKKKVKNEDDEFDKQLLAAGLLKKEPTLNGNGQNNASADAVDKAFQMKRELLDRIELLGERLPTNTLDQLIDDLGGTDNVAEMTGRKGRVVCTDEGINYESRSEGDVPLEILNLTEKQRFMDGEKDVAIISEAASSGISLQADRRAINQKRRVHITLELPWSADRAIQQFGRTHRSNQVSAPEYLFLISDLAGEQRFASTVSKRLESLGALTHGDRRATESRDLSRFNFDNKFGRIALESVMKTTCGFENPHVTLPEYKNGDFFRDARKSLVGVGMIVQDDPGSVPILEKDYNNISKFLNRLLGMEVTLQNALFKYFSNTLTSIILEAKRSGRWDMGILDLGSGGESVKRLETKIFVGNTATNTAKTELCTVSVERGMSFPSALDIWKKYTGVEDGFYISLQDRTSVRKYAIVAAYQGSYSKKKEKLYTVYRPNSGLQPRQETLAEIKKKYKKVLPEEAQRYWEEQYNASSSICSHAYWRGSCKKASLGLHCEVGLRTRMYYVLSGSVLSVWNRVESVLASMPGGMQTKMQIIRLRTDENLRIVGSLIPSNCVNPLCNVLSQDCSKTYVEKHDNERPKPREQSRAIDDISSKNATHSSPAPSEVYSMPMFV